MLAGVEQLDLATLSAGLAEIRQSPRDEGTLELIVRRPVVGEREQLDEALLDVDEGLVGDSWRTRGSRSTPDGSANPKAQLTLMNVRVAALVAVDPARIPLAGDQLYVDLDLSTENLPPGTRLTIGTAMIEISDEPHTGCRKFVDRFGSDAHRFVNAREHRGLNLRGVNAVVVQGGVVRRGDRVVKPGLEP
jgi:MOSC domain-containing protein